MILGQVFAFDIETIPDVDLGRRLHGLEGLSDKQVGYVMQTRQRELTGSEFLSLEQQRIVAISVAMRTRDGFRAWSLGEVDTPEAELVQRFFDGIGRYTPVLVSWNGSAFDLPVLTYRALRHQVQAPRYWETGDEDQSFRWNNYLGRFHWRHVDLMDVLSGYQGARPRGPGPSRAAARPARQARNVRRGGLGRLARWPERRDPRLLRDRRHQHLPDLPAIRAAARAAHARRARGRMRARTRLAAGERQGAPDPLPRRLAPAVRNRRITAAPEEARIVDLTHDGRGVARIDGKTIFVSDALPGERVILERTGRHRSYRRGPAGRGARAERRPRRAAVPAFRDLWRLRPAAHVGRGAARVQAGATARESQPGSAASRRRRSCRRSPHRPGSTAAAPGSA